MTITEQDDELLVLSAYPLVTDARYANDDTYTFQRFFNERCDFCGEGNGASWYVDANRHYVVYKEHIMLSHGYQGRRWAEMMIGDVEQRRQWFQGMAREKRRMAGSGCE
jgi:hypothetical protein